VFGAPLLVQKEFLLFKRSPELVTTRQVNERRMFRFLRTLGRAVGSTKSNAFCQTATSLVLAQAIDYFSIGLEARGNARSGVLLLVNCAQPEYPF